MLLPPFRPFGTMKGTPASIISSLDSTTLTKPTGAPIINAGFNLPSLISSYKRIKAVGAFPIAK